jgi:hypothetical protein
MATAVKHGIAKYNAGCRCDVCKRATSEYHKARRQRLAESVGDPQIPPGAGLRVINNASGPVTSDDLVVEARPSVVAAVKMAIEALGEHNRPDLEAGALAMAAILDNNKAVATQPAAVAKMADLMAQLRKSGDTRKSKLAAVRSMTSANGKVKSTAS